MLVSHKGWGLIRRGWKQQGLAFLIVAAGVVSSAQDSSESASSTPPAGATVGTNESRASVAEIEDSAWGEDYQIQVMGENARARVLFQSYANELRNDFRWVLYTYRPGEKLDRSYWVTPIRIELWGDVTDAYRGSDTRTGVEVRPDGRFHLQVAVRLHDQFEEESFRLELVRALVIEHMLLPIAARPDLLAKDVLKPPAWIVHGFDQLLAHRQAGRPSSFYNGALRSGQILSPSELFAQEKPDELDPLDYTIFRASAAAMVEALLDQPEGDVGLRALLADLGQGSHASIHPLLRQHFPAFREMDKGLEKWWALQVASLGQQQRFEFMDREETERWLTEALMVRFEGGETEEEDGLGKKNGLLKKLIKKPAPAVVEEPYAGSIEQYAEFINRPQAKEKLAQCFDKLQQLKLIGFPLYRPVVNGYEKVIGELIHGKGTNVDAQLAALEDLRNTVGETLIRTEDYMNYYEATRSPRRSEIFDDYIKMRQELDRQGSPKRKDRISRYLDALEMEFR